MAHRLPQIYPGECSGTGFKPWLNRIVAKLGRHVPHLVILKANSTGGERDDAKSDSEEVIHLIYQS